MIVGVKNMRDFDLEQYESIDIRKLPKNAYYHYTNINNLDSILNNGLIPAIGDNAVGIEKSEKIFFTIGTTNSLVLMESWLRWLIAKSLSDMPGEKLDKPVYKLATNLLKIKMLQPLLTFVVKCEFKSKKIRLKEYKNLDLGGPQDREDGHNTKTSLIFLYKSEEDEENKVLTKVSEFNDLWGENPIFFISDEETARMKSLAMERFDYVKEEFKNNGKLRYISDYTGYPVTKNNDIDYYSLGEDAFKVMLEELKKAEKFIFFEYFIVNHGIMWNSILEILEEKVKNGVDVRVIYDEVGALARDFHDFVQLHIRENALSKAQQRIIQIRQEMEKRFGHYDIVRRTTTGILQADDIGIVKKDTISNATEELMISTPGYWLAPCLVALSAWINDQPELAERALKEGIKRNDEKTSLFFALICRRADRKSVALKWTQRYLANQDEENLDRKTVIILDAFASGLLGADSDGVISKQMG